MVKKADFTELKSLKNPPKPVKELLEMFCKLFGDDY